MTAWEVSRLQMAQVVWLSLTAGGHMTVSLIHHLKRVDSYRGSAMMIAL